MSFSFVFCFLLFNSQFQCSMTAKCPTLLRFNSVISWETILMRQNVKVVLNHDRGLKVCKCTDRSFCCPLLRCEGPKSLGTFEKQVPGLNFSGLSLARAFYKYPTDHRQGFFCVVPGSPSELYLLAAN